MVFYLKYRPQNLDELDNTEVAVLIGKYLSRPEIPHAFLFTGSRGTGKTSTARIIAKSINCPKRVKGQACGKCEVCLAIGKGEHLDILEIDAASNRGIDEIRDLREKIKLAPAQLAYKVYIIDEVHMLTSEAFNALLKTLEEPPKHAVFILATTEAHKIPQTISSRCVLVNFHKATSSDILHSLKRAAKGEKLEIDEPSLVFIAKLSDGSFRDAHKLLEEVSLLEKPVTVETIRKYTGESEEVLVQEFLKLLQEKKAADLLKISQTLLTSGKNVSQFYKSVLNKLQALLLQSFTEKSDWQRQDIIKALKLFSESFGQIKSSIIPTLPFEIAIVEYCEGVAASHVLPPNANISKPMSNTTLDLVSLGPIGEKWEDILNALKSANHSIVGVLRSCRPLELKDNILTIEASYKFHEERMSEIKVRDLIAKAIGDVTGINVKIQTVLKKR